MTQEEKQAFDALAARVATLEALLKKIPAPAWFVKEFGSADLDGLILDRSLLKRAGNRWP